MIFSIPNNIDGSIPIESFFQHLAAHGFSVISLHDNYAHCDFNDATSRLQLLAYAKNYQVTFDTLFVPATQEFDLTCTDGETRMTGVCNVANAMHAARVLGVRTVVLSVTHALPSRSGSDTASLLHALEGLVESAEIMGINLAMRNLVDSKSLSSLHSALRQYNSRNFGLCYDTAFDQLADHTPLELLDNYCDRLKAVVFADTDGISRYDLPPGEGAIDWHLVVAKLAANGYREPISIRAMSNPGSDLDASLQSIQQAISYLNSLSIV